MDWVRFDDGQRFAFEYPKGWQVRVRGQPLSCIVSSPDGLWLAVIHALPLRPGLSPAHVIGQAIFQTAQLFPDAIASNVTADANGAVEGDLTYRAADGSPGRAHVVCQVAGGAGTMFAVAAPAAAFDAATATLSRILRTQNQGRPAPTTAAMPTQFMTFRDPQAGTFTMDAPVGWRVNGGFHHPGLGDVRPWFELTSPEGIYVASDPGYPQALCHMVGVGEGRLVTHAAGGLFLNCTPGADRSADCYLSTVAPRRLAGFKPVGRRQRPDVEKLVWALIQAEGTQVGRGGLVAAVETILERPAGPGPKLVASLLTTAAFNGTYAFGLGFWGSANVLCVAPAEMMAVADGVRSRVLGSLRNTPAMHAVNQQDAAQIEANTQVWMLNRNAWFAGQQAAHLAQEAAGDAIVQGYWSQQRANERMARGWEQNQAVYDRLSQSRSDAMMDRQRLADDAGGYEYEVAAGSNYYWLNPQTQQVVGTVTDQPPDLTNTYAALRKL
jgi:hypothetical protein